MFHTLKSFLHSMIGYNIANIYKHCFSWVFLWTSLLCIFKAQHSVSGVQEAVIVHTMTHLEYFTLRAGQGIWIMNLKILKHHCGWFPLSPWGSIFFMSCDKWAKIWALFEDFSLKYFHKNTLKCKIDTAIVQYPWILVNLKHN